MNDNPSVLASPIQLPLHKGAYTRKVIIMTMMDKIQNMNIDELALFICNVSEGILEDEIMLDCHGAKSFAEFVNGEVKYDKQEYIKNYLSSSVDFI